MARTWPNFWVSEQANVETFILASSSPETSEMAGGGTRKRAGSFRSPSYCIMPTKRVCAHAHGRRQVSNYQSMWQEVQGTRDLRACAVRRKPAHMQQIGLKMANLPRAQGPDGLHVHLLVHHWHNT